MAPDNDNYEMSFVEFNTEKLENYNWNYLDYYVATRGDQEEFVLNEKLKHWRFRLYLLPVKPFYTYRMVPYSYFQMIPREASGCVNTAVVQDFQ